MVVSSGKLLAFVAALAIIVFESRAAALASNPFHVGESFVVAQQGTPLMIGSNTLARLSQGQRLNVLQAQGNWLGTSAVVNGRSVSGWIHKTHVATPTQYAQRRTVRRSYSFQPGRGWGGSSSSSQNHARPLHDKFFMGQMPYGPAYWRADRKIVGY